MLTKILEMGRMKDIYMEVVQENGLLPENFNLAEYLHKKNLEDEEWKNKGENSSSPETSDDKKPSTDGTDV